MISTYWQEQTEMKEWWDVEIKREEDSRALQKY